MRLSCMVLAIDLDSLPTLTSIPRPGTLSKSGKNLKRVRLSKTSRVYLYRMWGKS